VRSRRAGERVKTSSTRYLARELRLPVSGYYRPVPEIDAWIRRRVRMCHWKQWQRTRKRVRHPLALGTGKRQAILTALSRKRHWHLSSTLATQTRMTNAWLERQKLLSVRAMWMKAHCYA